MEIDSVNPWKRKSRGALKASDMDIDTKRAALKASPSVVSVVSYKGGKMMLPGSGTIIDCEEVNGTYTSTILTSTALLRSSPESNTLQDDMKVNVYLADGKSFEGHVSAHDFYLNIATISITSDVALPTASLRLLDDSLSLYPSDCNSNYFKLGPGDIVVAIGRSCDKTHELRVTPGKFSRKSWKFGCGELFKSSCIILKVIKGSPAEKAGILSGDVIVQCGKKEVQSFLEFYDIIWEKVRETVEVGVIRESSAAHLILKVFVDETSSDEVNSWPVPKTYEASVKRIQHR
ncbi:putative protease Do-like 14 isoform X2 [Rhododendron vialii]|uniref:putative protease Do-like 14 isoform X2 n=1 Tax=Rhododendron vialii TaxID=182163 RepID=UPI00265FDEF9|nr:putative protease Do-like 14 isoform X2 [Rhododendron vialii]